MNRRTFLKTAAVLYGSGLCEAAPVALPGLDRFKLGAISDGFSQNFEEALRIMSSYGLSWVEIRNVFGIYNTEATPAQIRELKELLGKYRLRVSVIDSALYKCALPGTEPLQSNKGGIGYAGQMDLLKRACDRAHALGTDKIRGFTFWRVAEPEKISKRIADELGKAADIAKSGGMRLVIENEESCNAATGKELAATLALSTAHNLGANWDVGNGYFRGEVSFPDGYNALEHKRIWHMHVKGVGCRGNLRDCAETVAGEGQIDLLNHFKQLLRDGYQETISLECEFKAPGLTHQQTTIRSLEGLLKIASAAVSHEPR